MKIAKNCSRWTGFTWSLLVTQAVTYIRTTPKSLHLLFIPYKFLVCMMINFRITKKDEKRGGQYKTAATKC